MVSPSVMPAVAVTQLLQHAVTVEGESTAPADPSPAVAVEVQVDSSLHPVSGVPAASAELPGASAGEEILEPPAISHTEEEPIGEEEADKAQPHVDALLESVSDAPTAEGSAAPISPVGSSAASVPLSAKEPQPSVADLAEGGPTPDPSSSDKQRQQQRGPRGVAGEGEEDLDWGNWD